MRLVFLDVFLTVALLIVLYLVKHGGYCGFEGCTNYTGFPLPWFDNAAGWARLRVWAVVLDFLFFFAIIYMALIQIRKRVIFK